MKLVHFESIPQLTQSGSWECDYPLHRVWTFIEEQQRDAGLNLDPDFQRAHVWNARQQRAWLEFFLRGGVTSRVIYFNSPSWHGSPVFDYDEFVIVDGKQRLEAIRRFLHNEIKVFGSYFREFKDSARLTHTIKINVNDLPTREAVLRWYLETNEGGVKHTPSELRRVRELLREELRAECRRQANLPPIS